MTSIINGVLHNEVAIVFIAITTMFAVPSVLTYWYKSKKAAMDADLKMKMLELGMSAQDIERVLKAESPADSIGDVAAGRSKV